MTSASTGAASRIRGLVAAVFTLVLLVGIPLALIAVGADPVPDQLPTGDDITRVLNQPTTDPTWLFVILIAVAWGAWAVFAISFFVELIATIRGTTVKAAHSLSPRGTARGLIAAMALLVTPAVPMTAFAMQPEVIVTQSAAPASSTVQSPHEAQGSPKAQTRSFERYEVERGDTLWDIADEELNDGDRFGEIFRASRSTIQPDGKQLSDPDHIEPGWRLRIPVEQADSGTSNARAEKETKPQHKASAGPPTKPPATSSQREATAPQREESTTRKENTASQKERADPRERKAKPVPESSASERPEPSASSTSDTQTSAAPTPETPAPETAQPLASQEAQPTSPPPTPSATHTVPAPAAAETGGGAGSTNHQGVTPPTQFPTYEEDGLWSLRTASGVGALLAAGLGVSLATRRMIQRRRRRPGQLIPLLPTEDLAPERELGEIADPLSMRRVDLALRTLSRDCSVVDQPLPAVRQARLSEHQFDLFLAEPAQLPEPWCGTNDGTVWTLDAATIPVEDQVAIDVPAPYPALVTIGHTTIKGHEAHLLLDLDYVAALGVVGDETAVAEIVRALSLELATSVWADDLQVTAIGTLSELENALQSGRVHHVASPQPTLDQVDQRCKADSEALSAAELDLRSARAAEKLPEVWSPEVIVAAQALSDEQRQELGVCVSRQPRAAISTITAHDSLGEWFLDLDPEDPGMAILQPLGLRLEPQRVSDEVYRGILQTFTRADRSPAATGSEAAATPEPSLASLPDEPLSSSADAEPTLDLTGALPTQANPFGDPDASAPGSTDMSIRPSAPVIKLLGQPEISGADGPIEATKRSRCLEIACYLALCPQVGPEALNAALWPGDLAGEFRNVRNALLSRTRRWLGTDAEGGYWLQYAEDGACSLQPDVTTDWDLLNQVLPNGPFNASDSELEAAMRLIRGRPFQGVSTQRYAWAATLIQDMVPFLTDIAYELSTRLLTSGRWADATAVAARGLEVDELYEPLWRIRIMATTRTTGPESALVQIQQLQQALDHYGLDLEEETLELVTAIRSPVPHTSAG